MVNRRGLIVLFGALLALGAIIWSAKSRARDLGQWTATDPAIRSWYEHLMQPDAPEVPCCSFADGYYADTVETKDGQLVAVITDTRPDEPLGRPHVPVGTRIAVPPNKIKWDNGNPTGHIVIFLGIDRQVFCYVQNGGV